MSTRSDQERDQCIDMLIARVQELEGEVLRLKGDQHDSAPGVSAPKVKPVSVTRPARSSELQRSKSAKPSSSATLENVIGTRWIGTIGIVAVIFGVSFFLKYSFDNNLIGEAGRVMLGIVGGIAFLITGEYLQKNKNLGRYAQILSGGGLAVLYLSLYAAFTLYHLIPAFLATIGMVAVTTTGITLSHRYSAYSLALVALAGGFLTPVLLSTGENQPVELFSYILLLDLGTLLLLRFRQWPSLAAISLFGTALLYALWHEAFYSLDQHTIAFVAVTVFFIVYNLYLLFFRDRKASESTADHLVIFGSGLFFFMAFLAQQEFADTWPVRFFALLLAGIEIGLAGFTSLRSKALPMTVVSYAVLSIVLTVIATFVTLGQHWVLAALSVEMAVLGWWAFKLDLPVFRWGVYLLGLVVLLRFSYEATLYLAPFESFVPVFNKRFPGCALAIAGFYVLLYAGSRHRNILSINERSINAIIFFITQALSLILLSLEVHEFFDLGPGSDSSVYAYQMSLSVLWTLYASFLIGVGIVRRIRRARILGILILGVAVLKVFFMDLSFLETVYRIISFIVLGLLLLAVSYGYNRFRHIIFGEDQS
ncbi:membrane protein [Chlorobaculum parvum NCIB 8327]|uniref:Membrane protein n=2 Tax=Chlorobaculum parvum TaxID=274539 RepID=B3QNX0_CHLP8|nr:membrane protein [Chlorobaculum parvum NCIB 8327]